MTGAVAAICGQAKGGVVISAGPGGTYSDVAVSPADAGVTITFTSGGDINIVRDNGPDPDIGDWMSPKLGEPAANYEIKVDPTSGTFSGGTTGVWLALSTSRSWFVVFTTNAAGSKVCTASYKIRRVSDSAVLSDVSYSLEALVEI